MKKGICLLLMLLAVFSIAQSVRAEELPEPSGEDPFVSLVETLPNPEQVKAFRLAREDMTAAYAMTEKDMPLPDREWQEYKAAYQTFAEVLGVEAKTQYPDKTLLPLLRERVQKALAGVTEESPADAVEMLQNILAADPELENTSPKRSAKSVSTVSAAKENIQMQLFNFGPAINTPLSGYGHLPFIHSEGAYGWAVDSNSNKPAASSGGWPVLKTVLSGFPYVASDKNTVIKAGSLSYLFDPKYSGTGRVSRSTYLANISTNPDSASSPYAYGSVYLPVKNNGEGTGLFRKEGRYYVYDSGKNAAWYDPDAQKFRLYNYVLRPAYTPFSTSATNGNFLPFNQGHTQGREDYQAQTYKKAYTYTDDSGKTVEATTTIAKPDTVTTKPSGARTAYRLYGNTRLTEVDLWFAMALQFDFYQPQAGQVDGEDMVFEFLGDDDVFVYLDDVLILDIGGIHGAQAGRINFATGKVTNPSSYGQYPTTSTLYELMKAAKGDALEEDQFIDANGDGTLDTFADLTKHKLKFYYMERGGNISYCKLKFNMDPLPTGAVSLEKEVAGVSGNIPKETDYTFQIQATPKNESDVLNAIPYTKYFITAPDKTTSGEVANGGSFTLRHQERIVFQLSAGTKVTLTEEAEENTAATQWKRDGKAVESASWEVDGEGTAVEFLCVNTPKTGKLTLKKVLDGPVFSPEQEFSLHLSFSGKPYTGPAVRSGKSVTVRDGKLTLSAGDSLEVSGIPLGISYGVSEDVPQSHYAFQNPKFGDKAKEFGEIFRKNFTKSHTLKVTNRHCLADLTLSKTAPAEKDQTFLFRLTGGPSNLDRLVVVPGNGAVTVKDLPVGQDGFDSYKVTELTDWSWRFTFVTAQAQQDREAVLNGSGLTFRLGSAGERVNFTNSITEDRWLSRECYCENRWLDQVVRRLKNAI